MQKRYKACLLILLSVILLPVPAIADIVHLKDGKQIEGIVEDLGDSIKLKQKLGSIFIQKKDILRIEKKLTTKESFDKQLLALKITDWEGHYSLYLWGLKNGIDRDSVTPLLGKAYEIRLKSLNGIDATAHMKLYEWASKNKFDRKITDALLDKIITIDPAHEAGRKARREEMFRGKWAASSKVKKILSAEYAEKMRAKGYVYFHRQWIKPDAKELLLKLEDIDSRQKDLDDKIKYLKRDREDFRKEKEQARRDRYEAHRIKARANDDARRNAEKERSLARERDNLDDQREKLKKEEDRLADEQRKLDSKKDKLCSAVNKIRSCGYDIAGKGDRLASIAERLGYNCSCQKDRYSYERDEARRIAKAIRNLRDKLDSAKRDF